MKTKAAIIANRPFSNKTLFAGLVWRVLVLCLFFIVIPLIFYSFFLYLHVKGIKQQEAFIELGLFAEDQKNAIDLQIRHVKKELSEAEIASEYIKDPGQLSAFFRQMASFYPGEILLLAEKTSSLGWVTKASSESALLQMKPPCEPSASVVESCQWQGQNLFLVTKCLDESRALLFLSPIEVVIYPAERALGTEAKVNIRLLYQGNQIGPGFSKGEVHEKSIIFPYESIFRIAKGELKTKIPRDFKRIGTKINIEGTDYEIIIDAPVSIEPVAQHLWRLLSSIILLFIVLGGSLVFWLIYKMSKPIKGLAESMRKVEEGSFETRYQMQPFGFEINRLGGCFNHMLDILQKNIDERERQKIEKEKLAKELSIGHAIQKSLFPKQLPHLPHLDIATAFHPANRVAGDFYDLHSFNGQLLIVMADAAGKGISACLFSLSLRAMLRSLAESGKPLKSMVEEAHKLLSLDAKDSGMFITAWIGVLDLKTMELSYLSQGHYPAVMQRGNSASELDTQGSALGVETHRPFSQKQIKLQPGDLLFLYTDGLIEALRTDRRGILERFQAVDPQAKASHVIEQFTTPPPYEDDLTLLCIRISLE